MARCVSQTKPDRHTDKRTPLPQRMHAQAERRDAHRRQDLVVYEALQGAKLVHGQRGLEHSAVWRRVWGRPKQVREKGVRNAREGA